jgi:oligosaccharide repeat unit polymerase
MLVIALLLMLALVVLGWKVSRDLFSPFVVQPGVWLFIFTLYYALNPPYFPIQNILPLGVALWSVCFQLAAYTVFYYTPVGRYKLYEEELKPNPYILRAYLVISWLTIPTMLFILVKLALEHDPEHMFLFMRMLNVGVDEHDVAPDFGIANYAIAIPYILLFFTLIYSKSKKQKVLVILLNLMVGFLSMSKTNFLTLLFAVVYILYSQKKMKLRTIMILMSLFFLFSVVFQFFRASDAEQDSFGVTNTISLYLLSNSVAFDYYSIPYSAYHWGEHCFRFFYAVAHSFGSAIPPVDTIYPFVGVPDLTNTFTILHPFYMDFGMYGIAVFGLLYGALYGFLYKKIQNNHPVYKIIYTIFLNFIILQFFSEYILANLSLTLQYILLTIFPFLFQIKKNS